MKMLIFKILQFRDADVDPNPPPMTNCPIEDILKVIIPRGQRFYDVSWTEPSVAGSVTMDKSHGQPLERMEVDERVRVRYAFRDVLGNIIAECLFDLLGIRGEYTEIRFHLFRAMVDLTLT